MKTSNIWRVYESRNLVWSVALQTWVAETQPSGGGGGGAVTIADGSDVAEGATTDAAVVTDVAGTVSGKLRGLIKILADVWNGVDHALSMVAVDRTIAGVIAAVGNTLEISTVGMSTALIDVTGNFNLTNDTIVVDGSVDGATWTVSQLPVVRASQALNPTLQSTIAVFTPGVYLLPCSAYAKIRVFATIFGGAPVTVTFRVGIGEQMSGMVGRMDANQGLPGGVANAWPVEIVDATNFNKAAVEAVAPSPGEAGLVVRNLPYATTPAAPAAASVGVASAQIVAANANRRGLALINLSPNHVSFGLGAAAVLDNGITLTPNGVWEMDDFTFSTGAINAIASGAASPVAVQEYA